MRDIVTTALELLGLLLIVAGIFIAFGVAVALIAAGILAIVASFLLTRGGRR